MNHANPSVFRPIAAVIAASLIILLYACNLRTGTPATGEAPTDLLEATTLPVAEEFSYQPGIGSLVPWIDQSYVVYVPAGEFSMGQDEVTPSDHAPAHTVSVEAFWIHQTEVTNRMYTACVAAGVCEVPFKNTGQPYWYANPGHTLDPVVGVSWEQAATYCEWIEGRLPTEAEWEKAARGVEGDPYPWGDETPACDLLNYADCQETDQPVRVRTFLDGASPFLLADTAGNVSEWVQDWYDEDYYVTSPDSNPTGPASGTKRVIRSSNYDDPLDELEIVLRNSGKPSEHRADTGFRCVLTGETVGNPPPPVCEVLPYVPVLPEGESPVEPFPPDPTVSSFCMALPGSGASQGYVTLQFDHPVADGMYDITSSAGGLMVTYSGDTIGLSGPGIPVDTLIEITVCNAPVLMVAIEAECPVDYYLDEVTGTCRYGTPSMHDTPESCGPTEVWVPGYGCLHFCPVDPLIQCQCSLGYDWYESYHSTTPPGDYVICLPPDGPEDCLTDPLCSASNTCLEGYSYVTESDCCELPPDVPLYCPPGYTLKVSGSVAYCLPPHLDPLCTSFTVYIDNCNEPPPQLGCTDPGQYTNFGSCVAAFCRWVPDLTGGKDSYCTFP